MTTEELIAIEFRKAFWEFRDYTIEIRESKHKLCDPEDKIGELTNRLLNLRDEEGNRVILVRDEDQTLPILTKEQRDEVYSSLPDRATCGEERKAYCAAQCNAMQEAGWVKVKREPK